MEQLSLRALLPPAQVPDLPDFSDLAASTGAPVGLRPLGVAEGAAAYAVAEAALRWPTPLTNSERAAQQHAWSDAGLRLWSGWLQAAAGNHAWGAYVVIDGTEHLIGYARAIRDVAAQVEYLTELFVLPAFQGARIGQALLNAVLAPTVPPGWRRLITAHPQPAPLALYHRWGTFPLATAWYLMQRPVPPGPTPSPSPVAGLRMLDLAHDHHTLDWLDRTVLGRSRSAQHAFMLGIAGATGLVLERAGVPLAYGLRTGAQIGPVVGETPAALLTVLQALLSPSPSATDDAPGCWVPGANITALAWLRTNAPAFILAGQVTIMASDPSLVSGLDRAILPSPPYLG